MRTCFVDHRDIAVVGAPDGDYQDYAKGGVLHIIRS